MTERGENTTVHTVWSPQTKLNVAINLFRNCLDSLAVRVDHRSPPKIQRSRRLSKFVINDYGAASTKVHRYLIQPRRRCGCNYSGCVETSVTCHMDRVWSRSSREIKWSCDLRLSPRLPLKCVSKWDSQVPDAGAMLKMKSSPSISWISDPERNGWG